MAVISPQMVVQNLMKYLYKYIKMGHDSPTVVIEDDAPCPAIKNID